MCHKQAIAKSDEEYMVVEDFVLDDRDRDIKLVGDGHPL